MTTPSSTPSSPTVDTQRWDAVLRRDASADGDFCYAVRTTGVYCRPSCPSRRPRREHVTFFDVAAQAEAAGFRACRRCTPDRVSQQQLAVARVREILETAVPAPTLQQLAREVGLSPAHLQRVFRRAVGLSPKQYALRVRAEQFRARLRAGSSVTDAMYDAGYGSARSVYDQAVDQLGMTPGAYRRGGAGQRVAYALVDSPLGRMLVAATPRGLCALRFGEDEALTRELREEYGKAQLVPDAASVEPYVRAVLAHLAGRERSLPLPVDVPATAFQERVWRALRDIPYGETRSYAQLAQAVGQPSAVRAVAGACAANPVALVVPCHRVLRQGGELSGYRWGVERKRELLRREREAASDVGLTR